MADEKNEKVSDSESEHASGRGSDPEETEKKEDQEVEEVDNDEQADKVSDSGDEELKKGDSPVSSDAESTPPKKKTQKKKTGHSKEAVGEENSLKAKVVLNKKTKVAGGENRVSDKSPKKVSSRKKISDDEDEDEVEEEVKEEEKGQGDTGTKVGLFDEPNEREGKRVRKKVERLTMATPTVHDKSVDIPEGHGMKLGDCPRIEFFLRRAKVEDIKVLHRLLYNRPGSVTEVRRNIRKFCGFTFSKGGPEYEKKQESLNKFKQVRPLKKVCQILDIPQNGTKDDLIKRILTFLMEPEESGRAVPQSKKRSKGEKRKREGKTGERQSKRPKKEKSYQEDEVESEEEADEEESEEKSESSEVDSEEEKKQKKGKTASKKPVKKSPPAKKSIAKSPRKKVSTPPKKKIELSESSDSDDEPLVKKVKKPPTNEEIKVAVKKILAGANLEEVTMKTVCKQVYALYPDFDVTDRKDFIKSVVKEVIS